MCRSRIILLVMVSLAATIAQAATTWVADFTSAAPESWTGSDETTVANYADTTGANPNSFTLVALYNVAAIPDGWLTQGERGGVPTTAKFWNPPDGVVARARFTTPLPASMDAQNGVSFGWTARYGSYTMRRAPIQLCVTTTGVTGGTEYNAFFNVENGTTLRIQSNGGSFYSAIDPLAVNVGDGQFHQWSCAVIADGARAHWKLWLDGVQLLFTGLDGAHQFDPGTGAQQFSFQTTTNDFSGNPYIGLGDLHNTPYPDVWDFEFDCVAYKDEGLEQLTCGVTPSCDSSVAPEATQTSTALRAGAADPPSHAYIVSNGGNTLLDYTAVEMQKVAPSIASLYNTGVDNSRAVLGQPVVDPHWTIIGGGTAGTCTEGAPCPAYTVNANPAWLANDSTSLWITASATGNAEAPNGQHTFRTSFSLADQAAVDAALIRGRMAFDDTLVNVKLNGVEVIGASSSWGFASWQEFTLDSGFQVGANTLDFTVNNGGDGMGLRVEFFEMTAGDVPWLALDKSGGSIGEGSFDTVTASIVDTDLPAGTYTAYVDFTDSCSPAETHRRRIDLTVIDCRSAVTPAGNTARALRMGSAQSPAPVSYTFANTGAPPVSYTVTSDAAWLQLDKSSGGPINSGESDTVTGTINTAGLAAGGYVCTLTFTDTCNPANQHVRQVLLSVDETVASPEALQQFNAEFTTFTGSDGTAQSPLESCDIGTSTDRVFSVVPSTNWANLPSGWLTQGSIDGTPGTAKFFNPQDAVAGRARFRLFLPFNNTFDPAKGMAVAWRMWVGSNDTIQRGPIQITFPRVTGPFGTGDVSSVEGNVFNAYVGVQNTEIRVLNNAGGTATGVNPYPLANSLADQYHQWTASACYNAADEMAYWNLWVDGEKIMFDGANGSVAGPGGDVFSFRTGLNDVTGDPYIGLGELGSGDDVWDFEFDWVRMLTYNVNGCPFWDGEGCIAAPSCNTPFADFDGDTDVDMEDFAAFQLCINGGLGVPVYLNDACRCFDRNGNKIVGDTTDLLLFAACGTGAGVAWQPSPGCP